MEKGLRIGDAEGGARFEQDDGGIDLGRRAEGRRLDSEEAFGVREEGGLDGEVTVIAAAWGGDEALGDLLLHEEDGAGRAQGQGAMEDGRGDVVGKVAGDGSVGPAGEVGGEDVGLDDFEAGLRRKFQAKVFGELVVELDGDDAAGALEQLFGERAAAGADFDDEFGGRRTGGRGDAFEQRTAGQKVLAELLTGHPGVVSSACRIR